ncbi:MAG: tRNA (5-methylaminomethyl-2-thiouridine)(34)-methyltransferase MnmD [Mediterranea sp.]|jgi:tRNA U34 5-methylaminomethyl-2-thiouridine-forming methyltransferase MnmC|nr:tRNA (5-methylaminomethyl-2-thiouridine)(34)-methyltransferase MnmD [Mediterranea sp.]
MQRIIEYTDDGSSTLFVPELNEHYHSVKGARAESQHVFIDMGLKYVQTACPRVLEIGFGTGLNAFLSLTAASETGKKVHYTGLEIYPLEWDILTKLTYSGDPTFRQIHAAAWEVETEIGPCFTLLKKKADFTEIHKGNGNGRYDVVYFDAFAPGKQPEMWERQRFDYLYAVMNDGGALTTYCAKGVIRRILQEAGFVVERLPGPPGGKREILRAVKYPI